MRKSEFLRSLKSALRGIKRSEREKYLAYYSELIDDKIEEGMSEEQAVASLGSIDSIVMDLTRDAEERGMLKNRLNPLTITLIIIGSPLWISLVAVVFSLLIALYAVLWSMLAAFASVVFALMVSVLAAVLYFILNGFTPTAMFVFGGSMVCGALGVLLIKPLIAAVKWTVKQSGSIISKLYNRLFKRKGEQQ